MVNAGETVRKTIGFKLSNTNNMMIKRLFPYILLSLLLLTAGCEQKGMYTEVDFNVTLDASNTYYAGEPVVFNISGNPDNLVFYSGEMGSDYRYHDRYQVPEEDVEAMTLSLSLQHRFGDTGGKALDIYYTNDFKGLSGNDAQADKVLLQEMLDGGMQGWTKVEYKDETVKSGVWETVTADLSGCISNLCIAFHWHPDADEEGERIDTYFANGELTVDISGTETSRYDLETLMGTTTVMMSDQIEDPYHRENTNGWIRFGLSDAAISFAGGFYIKNPNDGSAGIDHTCEGWLVSTPRAFNSAEPDTGTAIKNIQNYLPSYSYTYEEPGTYDAVFVGANSNYMGASQEVKHVRVTVLPAPIE